MTSLSEGLFLVLLIVLVCIPRTVEAQEPEPQFRLSMAYIPCSLSWIRGQHPEYHDAKVEHSPSATAGFSLRWTLFYNNYLSFGVQGDYVHYWGNTEYSLDSGDILRLLAILRVMLPLFNNHIELSAAIAAGGNHMLLGSAYRGSGFSSQLKLGITGWVWRDVGVFVESAHGGDGNQEPDSSGSGDLVRLVLLDLFVGVVYRF